MSPCQLKITGFSLILFIFNRMFKQKKYILFGEEDYFNIETSLGEKTVRTYDDFLLLRNLLRNEFPTILVL